MHDFAGGRESPIAASRSRDSFDAGRGWSGRESRRSAGRADPTRLLKPAGRSMRRPPAERRELAQSSTKECGVGQGALARRASDARVACSTRRISLRSGQNRRRHRAGPVAPQLELRPFREPSPPVLDREEHWSRRKERVVEQPGCSDQMVINALDTPGSGGSRRYSRRELQSPGSARRPFVPRVRNRASRMPVPRRGRFPGSARRLHRHWP